MCCAGLLTGLAVGQVIGGPWTLLGPGIGFALGLLADTKIIKSKIKRTAAPVASTTHGVVHKLWPTLSSDSRSKAGPTACRTCSRGS